MNHTHTITIPIDNDTQVTRPLTFKSIDSNDDQLVYFGGEVKALGDGRVGGYLVLFGDENNTDLEGDYFTKNTDFGPHKSSLVLYQHGMDKSLKRRVLDPEATIKTDDIGVWVEAQLSLRDEYEEAIYQMAKRKKLGWSSGTAPHLVEREAKGEAFHITRWPLGLDASLTPTPAEPRTAAIPLKALQSTDTLQANVQAITAETNAKARAEDIETQNNETETHNEVQIKMSTEDITQEEQSTDIVIENNTIVPDIDYTKMAEAMVPVIAQAAQTQAVEAVRTLNVDAQIKAAVSEAVGAIANEPPSQSGAIAVPNIKRHTKPGFSDEENDAFKYYLKTGTKAALQEGTAAEGGVLVPNDFYGPIVEKRNEMSIPRAAGADVFRTSLQVVDIPTEDTAMTDFVLTAEEAAYDQNEPTFVNRPVTVYKYTKLVKISEELINDEASNLMQFLSNAVGRSAATTENSIFAVGTGSGQPQGVTVGGSNGVTAAGAAAITAGEVQDLYTSLGDYIEQDAFWMMAKETYSAIRQLTGNPFLFIETPQGSFQGPSLMGHRVLMTSKMPAMATGLKSVVFGNGQFYTLVENGSMTVRRANELYMANGQIGLFFSFRVGGIVTQSAGLKYLTQA